MMFWHDVSTEYFLALNTSLITVSMFFTRSILALACVSVPSQWSLLEKREDAPQIASKQAQGQKLNAIRTSVMGLAICSSFFTLLGYCLLLKKEGEGLGKFQLTLTYTSLLM